MKNILSIIALFSISFSQAQVVVNNNQNVDWYIQNVLAGPGVSVTNVTFNGASGAAPNAQVGEFTDATSSIGLPLGLILGSGDVTMAAQPNLGGSGSLGGGGGVGSDADLAAICPNTVYDECIVEFDFVPVGDSISFSYVFASEEYDEYVCDGFSDAFGFFLTGTNPSGGFYGSQNLALVPDPANPSTYTTTAVNINTINLGIPGSFNSASVCSAVDPNWASYNVFYAGSNVSTNYEYDGNTVVLTCKAAVVCNETYHIKLAIGDGGDGSLDSGVFLEGGSFTSVGVAVDAGIANGDTLLYEGCNTAYFAFTRPDTLVDFTVYFQMAGTATNGFDYLTVPDSLTLGAGVYTDTILIFPISDGAPEPTETVEMLIFYETCSGSFDTITANLLLNDYTSLTASLPDSINICPNEVANLTPQYAGGLGDLNFTWSSGQTTDQISVIPESTQDFTFTVSDACGNPATATTTVWVQCPVIAPNVFTPNSDGNNDFFIVLNLDDYENSKITIYNRWGGVIYMNENYLNNWDGTNYKTGAAVADGVYYYIVEPNSTKYEYSENKKPELNRTFTGYFQLMR
jgi:gliding motility-associated-like protein